MRDVEILATLIGELVATEIDFADKVEYHAGTGDLTAFTVTMEGGKRYTFDIKESA